MMVSWPRDPQINIMLRSADTIFCVQKKETKRMSPATTNLNAGGNWRGDGMFARDGAHASPPPGIIW